MNIEVTERSGDDSINSITLTLGNKTCKISTRSGDKVIGPVITIGRTGFFILSFKQGYDGSNYYNVSFKSLGDRVSVTTSVGCDDKSIYSNYHRAMSCDTLSSEDALELIKTCIFRGQNMLEDL